jgi:multiple sugar transport system permease protein
MVGKEALNGYSFISLWVIGLIVFQIIPLFAVFYFSFTNYDVFSAPKWIGFSNYQKIFTDDPLFWRSLGNTIYIVVLSVPLRMVISLGIAIMLNQRIRGIGIYRTIFYLPMMVPLAATAVLWGWMLQSRLGIVNYFLEGIGIPGINWLVSDVWSKPAIILITLWRIGEPIVLFLAGLQNIPGELYEASEVDGAGWRHKLFRITLPLLTPTIFMLLVLEIIQLFQSFVWAFAMTKGGPLNSSLLYVLYIFRRAFDNFRMGYASALAIILFLIVLVLTVVLFRWSRYWVHTEVD